MNESVYMKRCLFKLQSVIVTLPGPRKSLATLWEDVVRSSKVSCASVRSGSWGGSVTSVCRATTTLTETTHWAVKVTSFKFWFSLIFFSPNDASSCIVVKCLMLECNFMNTSVCVNLMLNLIYWVWYFTECSCYSPGTVAGLNMCHAQTGQCTCKLDVVGRRCDTCASGFYGLSEANPFGCTG